MPHQPDKPDRVTQNRQSRRWLNRILVVVSAILVVLAWNFLQGRLDIPLAAQGGDKGQFEKYFLSLNDRLMETTKALTQDHVAPERREAFRAARQSSVNTMIGFDGDKAAMVARYFVVGKSPTNGPVGNLRLEYRYDGTFWNLILAGLSVDGKYARLEYQSIPDRFLSDNPKPGPPTWGELAPGWH